jgi:predicted HTH transcriptional regulator
MLCDKNMYAKIQQKSKERGKSMLQLERQQKILDYLKENRKATTNELSELLGVSTTNGKRTTASSGAIPKESCGW